SVIRPEIHFGSGADPRMERLVARASGVPRPAKPARQTLYARRGAASRGRGRGGGACGAARRNRFGRDESAPLARRSRSRSLGPDLATGRRTIVRLLRRRELVVDDVFELLEGLGTDEHAAVYEEGGCAGHAERLSFGRLRLHFVERLLVVVAVVPFGHVDPRVLQVLDALFLDVPGVHFALMGEIRVVELPVRVGLLRLGALG